MDDKLFTIAVVTYQQRHLLNECLKSIFIQDYENIELIICDDHSCDFDVLEVKDYIERHKSDNIKNVIVYQQEQNVGTVRNCQRAFELSSGKYLKFHAGDDMLADSEVFTDMSNALVLHSTKVVFTRARGCLHDGTITDNLYPQEGVFQKVKNYTSEQLFEELATKCWGACVCAPAVFWQRSFLEEMGGFDLDYKYTEDWPMWLKICAKGYCPKYINRITVLYRYGGISNSQPELTAKMAKEHYDESARMLREIAIPELKERHSRISQLYCEQAAMSLEVRGIIESEWRYYTFLQRLEWDIKNIKYFGLSLFLKLQMGRFNKSIKKLLLACIGICFLYHCGFTSFWNLEWSLIYGILLCMCVLGIVCRIVIFIAEKIIGLLYK